MPHSSHSIILDLYFLIYHYSFIRRVKSYFEEWHFNKVKLPSLKDKFHNLLLLFMAYVIETIIFIYCS